MTNSKSSEPDVLPRRPRGAARFSTASLVPVVLAVLAGTAAYAALADRSATAKVIVAARSIPAGAPIDAGDTRVVRVHASDTALVVGTASPEALAGRWVAAVPLVAGEPITPSELELPRSGPVPGEMSIPVPVQDAAGGRVQPGDAVDVIVADASGSSRYVAEGLRVVAVAPSSSVSALGGTDGGYFVVVDVDRRTALRIAGAIASATGQGNQTIEVVRSTGEGLQPTGSHKGNGAP
ncbi:MAG TPA: SAF domain-containing protein [Acidimicrobiales bacterium]|nr:SAF domain-containing protein [Acidimicrobiales bacterium]